MRDRFDRARPWRVMLATAGKPTAMCVSTWPNYLDAAAERRRLNDSLLRDDIRRRQLPRLDVYCYVEHFQKSPIHIDDHR